mgnify:CR=1 FL=1
MMIMVIGALAATLFLLSLMSRRRFGTLGLALAAGALLASTLARDISSLLSSYDIPTGSIPYLTAAKILLITLPPLLLLLSGPSYPSRKSALLGSICFGLLGTLLLLGPISEIVPYDDQARLLLSTISPYTNSALALLVGFAIVDTWLTHTSNSLRPTNKKKS